MGKASDRSDGTVGKALRVLDQVAAFGRPARFSELLAGSPYPKATLYRLLQTLSREGMLSFDRERQTYTPGLRLVRLAHAAWTHASLAPVARRHLDRLSREAGETVHLAQLDHGQVLYVDKRDAQRPVEMFSEAGKVGPAYCTGVGKAMLAHLEPAALERVLSQQAFHRYTPATLTDRDALLAELAETRSRGYALDREEHEAGIICVAVPILATGGRVLGAISITGPTSRTDLAALSALAPRLRATAADIADEATTWNFPDHPDPAPLTEDGIECQA